MIACALFQPFELWHAIYLNPELKNKPLISLDKNKVKNCNSLAETFNIKSGMTLEGAKANCDELITVETTVATLSTAWDDLLNQLYAFTNQIEVKEQGVVFLDLIEKDARLIANAFNCKIAFASNKQHAHLLALTLKEKEVLLLKKKTEKQKLKAIPLPLLDLLGIHPKTIERFHWLGLETLADLQNWSKNQLSLYLTQEAKLLLPYLKGPFDKRIAFFKPSLILETSYQFEDAVLEPHDYEPVLYNLVSHLTEKLGDKAALRLTVHAELEGLNFSASRLNKEALSTVDRLYRLTQQALKDTGILGLGLDALKLELSGIYRPSEQLKLFQQKETKLKAIQTVEQRFPNSLLHFEEVNPYMPITDFSYKAIPLGSGSEVKREKLSFASRDSRRQTQAGERQARLIRS